MSNNKKSKNNLSKVILKFLASVLVVIGYVLMVMPYAIDTYSRIGQTATIGGYKDAVSSMNEMQIEEAFIKSSEYNEKIAKQHEEEFYRYSSTTEYDEEYLSLPVEGSGEICTIVIPNINVNLSVGHGTSDELLQVEAGHLYGTSLPTGGNSTHSVIAAHTALRTSEMFSRLDELKKGDTFYIKVLGQTHAYVVDQIIICLPDECDQYMQVIPNEDHVTLYTCTPYGINSHRLLVRGIRTTDPVAEVVESGTAEVVTDNLKYKIMLGGMILFPIILIILINFPWDKLKKSSNISYSKK